MEALLSLAFDNISSKDGVKVRKGIRQIEGLLAQICLDNSAAASPHKRRTSTTSPDVDEDDCATTAKSIDQVVEDAAFVEFFRLQEGFEWNGESVQLLVSKRPAADCENSGVAHGDLSRDAAQYAKL